MSTRHYIVSSVTFAHDGTLSDPADGCPETLTHEELDSYLARTNAQHMTGRLWLLPTGNTVVCITPQE